MKKTSADLAELIMEFETIKTNMNNPRILIAEVDNSSFGTIHRLKRNALTKIANA